MNTSERLHRRRCLGLRVGVFFAVALCTYYHADWAIVAVVGTGGVIAIIAYWRDCRTPTTEEAQTDEDTGEFER